MKKVQRLEGNQTKRPLFTYEPISIVCRIIESGMPDSFEKRGNNACLARLEKCNGKLIESGTIILQLLFEIGNIKLFSFKYFY